MLGESVGMILALNWICARFLQLLFEARLTMRRLVLTMWSLGVIMWWSVSLALDLMIIIIIIQLLLDLRI